MIKELEQLTELSKPLIKWLNENKHPHHIIIINPTGFELLEGVCANPTISEFVKD